MTSSPSKPLRQLAIEAAGQAYCPYSDFRVGCVVSSADGRHFQGCNVENASYGLTNCAERTAMFAAIAAGVEPGDLVALTVYTPGQKAHGCCGACRQVIIELMHPKSTIECICDSDDQITLEAGELLPHAFELKQHPKP